MEDLSKYSLWLEKTFKEINVVITGDHLVLTSGKHSGAYINLRLLAGYTDILYGIGRIIALAIDEHENDLDCIDHDYRKRIVIVGPETLGRTFAEFTAIAGGFDKFAWCDMKKDFMTEKDSAEWNPKLNFAEMVNGAWCYIIDDLLTTSKSVKLVKQLIEETGGNVKGVVVVVRRDQEVTAETVGVPWLYPLLDVNATEFKAHEADSCPLCKDQVPMRLRPGHGHEWIKEHENYPVAD